MNLKEKNMEGLIELLINCAHLSMGSRSTENTKTELLTRYKNQAKEIAENLAKVDELRKYKHKIELLERCALFDDDVPLEKRQAFVYQNVMEVLKDELR